MRLVLLIGVVNFAVFVAMSLWLGGDAVRGFEANGSFYLTSRGDDTEVSYLVFIYSLIHARITFALFAAAFGLGLIMNLMNLRHED